MKFRFIGEEPSEIFGFRWFPGTEHDVTDEHAISKLKNMNLFEAVAEETAEDKPKRQKKPAQPVIENGDDTDNV